MVVIVLEVEVVNDGDFVVDVVEVGVSDGDDSTVVSVKISKKVLKLSTGEVSAEVELVVSVIGVEAVICSLGLLWADSSGK